MQLGDKLLTSAGMDGKRRGTQAESALSAAEYSGNAAIAWPGRKIWSGKSSTRGNGRTLWDLYKDTK